MRKLVSAIFCVAMALLGGVTGAMADQTDPRLDLLFEELRTGDALRAQENTDRIVEIWTDSASDTVDVLLARAGDSLEQGADGLALALLDHVIGLSPNFAQGYALRGEVRLVNNDQDGAIEDFSKALELEPRHFQVRVTLANILYASGEPQAAYEMYQKALEWNPHDENARSQARKLRIELEGQEI